MWKADFEHEPSAHYDATGRMIAGAWEDQVPLDGVRGRREAEAKAATMAVNGWRVVNVYFERG